jgi:hypothetical protein
MPGGGLAIVDDDGEEVVLERDEVDAFLALTGGLDAATVSACPDCRSRVVAAVALVDLLDAAPPHPRARAVVELADDAPSLHLYVEDRDSECRHPEWRDPGAAEWDEVLGDLEWERRGLR